jgi:iron complex outermembrane receptor protein
MMKKLTASFRGTTPGKPHIGLLSAAVIAALASNPVLAAEDLGIIQVESTTIDDRFESKRQEPSNIAVISGEEVDAKHPENIQQILQSVPGITTELQSGDSLKIHIRGVENQRYMGEKPGVAVVIDGVPVFERTGRVNIDLDNIESIKVIKGGASYLFGDDALSGAVIITTKRGAKYAGFTAGLEAGSFGYRKYLGRAGFANEHGSGHIQVSQRSTDGYYADSESKSEYLNGKLQYYLDDVSDITFGMEISDREKDSHGTVDGITSARLDPKSAWTENDDYARMYDVHLEKFFATYSRDIGETDNLLVNAYQFTDDTAFVTKPINGYFDGDGDPITDPDAYAYGNDYFQVQRGIKAEYRSGGEEAAWMAGLDLRANTYENSVEVINSYKYSPRMPRPVETAGTVNSDDETDETIQALYGELKFKVTDPLTMTVNGRYDHIALDYLDKLEDTRLDKTFNVWSWRLGGNYALNSITDIYGNVSTGFRAPSVTQLFAGDIDPDGSTASNPDLEPEEARNFEIGMRRKFAMAGVNWDLDAALFRIDRDDYIMSTAGQYASTLEDELLRYENIGGMQSRGLELSLRSDSSNKFWVNVAYSYLDAFFTQYDNYNLLLGHRYGDSFDEAIDGDNNGICDDAGFDPESMYCLEHYDLTGNQVPRAPRHHLNIGLNWRAAPHWILTGEIEAKSSYYADEMNWNKVSGHTVFNLLATYDRKFGEDNTVSFFARIDNVFDKDYWNTARGSYDSSSPGTGGVPDGVFDMEDISIVVNPGRTFTAGLNVTF